MGSLVKFFGIVLFIGILAVLVYFIFRSFTAVVILLIGAFVVLLLLGLLSLFGRAKKRRAAQQFGSSLAMQGGAAPAAMSQAEELARLDDIRKRFEEGLSKYKSAGKDIYSLPWYMIVGEPGSGKTEAVRRSGISFPSGMQDEFQGAGGTINMNWWFANQAVLLDLAGRLVFEDVVPGKTSEWTEFLKLLGQSRPNCPVNGMLLVIPADSLIQDSPQDIQQKANKLAQQCEIVQRALDIRFPVYVIVTKCDLVIGFRELFDDLNTPAEQGQILGWSNPNTLDTIFNPKELDRHLDIVRQRLVHRRHALIEDPRPQQDLSKRRIDEVDALFDFPNRFDKVVPPLQQYLENIFVKSEWSAKPLFLRGIYFTSSMREGAAIDDALAEVLGGGDTSLPEGRAWERDKSFFLKDLFVEKVFRESGLVTRATNVQNQGRKQKFTLLACAAIGLATLIGLTFFGGRSLDKAVKKEHDLWSGIIKSWPETEPEPKSYMQIVAPKVEGETADWDYRGSERLPRSFGKKSTLGEAHKYLVDLSETPPKVPLIFRAFRPLGEGLTAKRRQATRSAYEMSVLHPIINGTRKKLTTDEAWDSASTAALRQLLKIECDEQGLAYDPGKSEEQISLDSLVEYLIENERQLEDYELEDADSLNGALEWSYDDEGGEGEWPPAWAAEGGKELADNPQLDEATQAFMRWCTEPPAVQDLKGQIEKLNELRQRIADFDSSALGTYVEKEEQMATFLQSNLQHMQRLETFYEMRESWPERFDALKQADEKLKEEYASLSTLMDQVPLVQQDDLDLAFSNSIKTAVSESIARFKELNIPFDRRKIERLRDQRNEDEESDEPRRGAKEAVEDLVTAELNLLDEMQLAMLDELEGMEKRYSSKSILKSLKEFQGRFVELKTAIGQKEADFAIYEPLLLPDELHTETDLWKSSFSKLTKSNIDEIHRSLTDFCLAVDKRAEAWSQSWGEEKVNVASIEALRLQAKTGMTDLAKFNSSLGVKNVLGAWERKFVGNPLEDRTQILGQELEEFSDQLLVRKSEKDGGFYFQYWHNAMTRALESLKIQAINERKNQSTRTRVAKYKAFPLAPMVEGVPDLTENQLLEAQEFLDRFRPYEDAEEPSTLATGQKTDMTDLNEIIDALRTLDLDKYSWDRQVYQVLDQLPKKKDSKIITAIILPTLTEQTNLILKNGKASIDTDSFLGVWKYFMLGAEGAPDRQRAKWSLHVFKDDIPAKKNPFNVPFPIPTYEFRFFANPGNVVPDQMIPMKGPWGPLRLIHEHPSFRDEEDPMLWTTRFQLKDKLGRDRFLWMKFRFDGAVFPTLDSWPGAKR